MNTAQLLDALSHYTDQPLHPTLDPWLATSAYGRAVHLLTGPGERTTWCRSTAERPLANRTAMLRCHGCHQALTDRLGPQAAQAYLSELRERRQGT